LNFGSQFGHQPTLDQEGTSEHELDNIILQASFDGPSLQIKVSDVAFHLHVVQIKMSPWIEAQVATIGQSYFNIYQVGHEIGGLHYFFNSHR
jgi:hypothetical protein